MSTFEEKTLIRTGDTLGNEVIHYPITKTECIKDLDEVYFPNKNANHDSYSNSKHILSTTQTFATTTFGLTFNAKYKFNAGDIINFDNVDYICYQGDTVASSGFKVGEVVTINFNKTTKKCYFGGSGENYVTFVIGALISGYKYADVDVDYWCADNADQTIINQAITDLPETGGKILILEGEYSLTGSILVNKDNVTIEGIGDSTIINYNVQMNSNAIYLYEVKNCCVSKLCINSGSRAIFVQGCSNIKVMENKCTSTFGGTGIVLYLSSKILVAGNICNESPIDGIGLYDTTNSVITYNICNDNDRNGIYLEDSTDNVILGNKSNNDIVGDTTNVIESNNCANRVQYLVDSDSVITTAKIKDLAVTEGKLGTSAVTTAKIKDLAITEGKLSTALAEKIDKSDMSNITGVLATTNGGTSNSNGTVAKLTTGRTIRTNLASTSTASFDGSANVTPGVTGLLPIANGGTGVSSASELWNTLTNITKITIGADSTASGASSTALGRSATASGDFSAALGYSATASESSLAVGTSTTASGDFSAVFGYNSTASGENSLALGRGAQAKSTNSTALGYGAVVSTSNTIQLGSTSILSSLTCRVPLNSTSDERDKTDIEDLQKATEFLSKIRVITYKFNHRENYHSKIDEFDDKGKPITLSLEDETKLKKREKYGI